MKHKGRWYLIIGGLMVGAILFVAIFAEQLTGVSPYYFHTKRSILEGLPPFSPGNLYRLGTDEFGRDVWSRVAFGARWSLLFAFLIMGLRVLVALPMAALSTFGPRWVHWLVGRLYVFTSSVPPLLVYLLILSSPGFREVGLWPSVTATVLLLTVLEWPRIAVHLRGRIEELSLEPFVEGAVAAGATRSHIFWVHMLPHLWPTLLQTITAEMGRGLLTIAQLGFFGIWVGGGLIDIYDYVNGEPIYIISTGVPEWGTLLAGARDYIHSAPWIPIAPAMAFFIGIVGFNLLSQGMEGAVISLAAFRLDLPRSWRWGLRGLVIAGLTVAVLLYNHGLPIGKQREIEALAQSQAKALREGNVEQYLQTLSVDEPGLREGQRTWLSQVPREDLQVVVVRPTQMNISGGEATGLWTVGLGYKTNEISLTRSTRLVRRGGTWVDQGEALTRLRGLYTEVHAFFDPIDPTVEGRGTRYRVNLTSAVADHAYLQALEAAPWTNQDRRMILRLYPSHHAWAVAVRGLGARVDTDRVTVWQAPDGIMHISWDFVKTADRKSLQQALAFEMLKYLTADAEAGSGALPLLTGMLEVKAAGSNPYELLISKLHGQRFFTLEELFAAAPDELGQAQRPVYVAQSALLIQLLAAGVDQEQLLALAQEAGVDPVEAMARAGQMTRSELTARYDQYVFERLSERSVLNLPGGKARVPQALLDAIAARAEAVTHMDADRFLAFSSPESLSEHTQWLDGLKSASVQRYEAYLLDLDDRADPGMVTLLERHTLADGRTVVGISTQQWVAGNGSWKAGPMKTTWTPERR